MNLTFFYAFIIWFILSTVRGKIKRYYRMETSKGSHQKHDCEISLHLHIKKMLTVQKRQFNILGLKMILLCGQKKQTNTKQEHD